MKLEGLKVVDLSWFLPGPYLTTALADPRRRRDQGRAARRRSGRHIRPPDQRTSVFFRNMGAARRASCSTSRASRAAPISFRLACEADVLVESFRPGVAPAASASATRR
jgi:crotonobetainyl-CoA:carnitine CoA-transferase CaiB-like acyl-CoA transferase